MDSILSAASCMWPMRRSHRQAQQTHAPTPPHLTTVQNSKELTHGPFLGSRLSAKDLFRCVKFPLVGWAITPDKHLKSPFCVIRSNDMLKVSTLQIAVKALEKGLQRMRKWNVLGATRSMHSFHSLDLFLTLF